MKIKVYLGISIILLAVVGIVFVAQAWEPVSVVDDPLVRMPGTQQGAVQLPGSNQCFNCHYDYDPISEPVSNWQGSMMAQSARDFLYWPTVVVAAQDAIWAVGNPNATDICLRCHFPVGWLAGRSDPTNASFFIDADYDGVQCTVCHFMYDPFFQDTYDGIREGSDWAGYWDETNIDNVSGDAALLTLQQDSSMAAAITMFNGDPYFTNDHPPASYDESGGGQMFVDTDAAADYRRASFADANANHAVLYSRFHKSKYFCDTCHDIANPILHNLDADPNLPLPSETDPTYSYYHVERTFSEFMLSDYGQQGGTAGIGPFAPDVFETSRPDNNIATCQDCHMRDVDGKGADKNQALLRPDESIEHPKSGVPQHDLTGGNVWVSQVLASADENSPNYNATNDTLLNQGADVLTLDLSLGEAPIDPEDLLIGADRALQNLHDAAVIQNTAYDAITGELTFQIQNQTGHKLPSGYPEGRRIFVNVKVYDDNGQVNYEINPYDADAGTLKGLNNNYDDPDSVLPDPADLTTNEVYVDELVYEMHSSSSLTGEDESFHFALSTDRYKDNRIPPMGFRIDEANDRLSQPVWAGATALDYFKEDEYAGGYDEVEIDVPAGAASIEITLNYQTTSREYIEFLRNEINGTGNLTLEGIGAGGDQPYLVQSDPFFTKLKAWGDTIWQLWSNTMDWPGAAPIIATQATVTPLVAPIVSIASAGADANLNWEPVADAEQYEVWQAVNDPYFKPAGDCDDSDSCVETTDTTASQPLGDVQNNYTYVVLAAGDDDNRSGIANRVGTFLFALVPGEG